MSLYGIRSLYRLHVFVDAESIVANTSVVRELMDAIGDESLLPYSFEERRARGKKSRIGFVQPDTSLRLVLGGDRFFVIKMPAMDDASDMGTFEEFSAKAAPLIAKCLEFFQRKAHRCGGFIDGFLKEDTLSGMAKVSEQLMRFPNPYAERPPFEWEWRAITKVPREIFGRVEHTECSSQIMRSKVARVAQYFDEEAKKIKTQRAAEESPQWSDLISAEFDVSTDSQNVTARFDHQQISEFARALVVWQDELISDVFSYLATPMGVR